MGKGGGGSSTTTSSNQPPAAVLDAYTKLISQAQNTAQTPYTAYSGQTVAPLTDLQNQGLAGINAAQGLAQPYLSQAQTLANQSAGNVLNGVPQYSQAALQQYQDPYQQQVIDATQANINQSNAVQQQQLLGSAIQSGASPFGGDRAGVAAAELARNQNLASQQTIAGLESQGFQNAQQQFNTQQQLQLTGNTANANLEAQAANTLGNLGVASEGTALQGAEAQLAGGTLQQQTNQAGLTSAYNQFLQQQAYPFQTTQWLGNLVEGIGSNSGGTSTTTSPAPNSIFKRGGSVHMDSGGNPYGGDFPSYVESAPLTIGHTMPTAPQEKQSPSGLSQVTGLLSAANGAKSLFGGSSGGGSGLMSAFGGTQFGNSLMNGGMFSADLGSAMPWLEGAGGADALGGAAAAGGTDAALDAGDLAFMAKFAKDGGRVHKGGGGEVISDGARGAMLGSEIMPGWGTAIGAGIGGLVGLFSKDGGRVPRASGGLVPHYDDGGLIDEETDNVLDPDSTAFAPQDDTFRSSSEPISGLGATAASAMASAHTPSITGSGDITAANNPGLAVANANPQVESDKPSLGMALLAAGLGAAAGNSPYVLQNIAKGGLLGLQNYGEQNTQLLAQQKEKALEQHQQDMDAKPTVVSTGKTIQLLYPQEKDPKTGKKGMLVDTGMPSEAYTALQAGQPLKDAQINYYNSKAIADAAAVENGKFTVLPGTGQDDKGATVAGAWKTNTKTGESTFVPGMVINKGGNNQDATADLPKTPDGLIDETKVSPQVEQQAKAMIEGRAPYPQGMMLRQPIYQQALALAQQKDPAYDAATAPARTATYKKFTSGKSGDELTALNTSLGHYESLMNGWNKLNNGDYPILNNIKNQGGQAMGKGALDAFNQARTLLAPELMKAYGAGHSVTETQEFSKNFNPNASPEQQKAVLDMGANLMESKIQALQDSYERGMQTVKGFDKISKIGPKGVATLKKLGMDTSKYNLPSDTAPTVNPTPAEKAAALLPAEGATATNKSTGEKMIFRGGQWQTM